MSNITSVGLSVSTIAYSGCEAVVSENLLTSGVVMPLVPVSWKRAVLWLAAPGASPILPYRAPPATFGTSLRNEPRRPSARVTREVPESRPVLCDVVWERSPDPAFVADSWHSPKTGRDTQDAAPRFLRCRRGADGGLESWFARATVSRSPFFELPVARNC